MDIDELKRVLQSGDVYIDLSSEDIGDDESKIIADALKVNDTLEILI